jgi:hypothetical protein
LPIVLYGLCDVRMVTDDQIGTSVYGSAGDGYLVR